MLNDDLLRARFDVVPIDADGILIDREQGGVYRLNRTACEIWTAFLGGKSGADIGQDLARRFGLPVERAAADVLATLGQLPAVAAAPAVEPFRWDVTASGYGFFEAERMICEIDPAGSRLRLSTDTRPSESQARNYLKSVAPKLLALRGVFVLHASAVELGGNLRIFSGRSGAGKTSSARAFAQAGARLISEDLLVIAASGAAVGGEPAILAWLRDQAALLARAPDHTVPCEPLDRCLDGAQIPVAEILLVDADRRAGERIRREKLAGGDALVAMIDSAYFASRATQDWRARFVQLRDLVAGAVTWRVTMPLGLRALDDAARELGQRAMTAS